MNPFDLSGPEFLLFYFALSVITFVMLGIARRRRELPDPSGVRYLGTGPVTDPYLIAFLRGEKNELLRVAVVSLVDRGLLTVTGDRLQTSEIGRNTAARKQLEREILQLCLSPREPSDLFSSTAFDPAIREIEEPLRRMGLLPDAEVTSRRRTVYAYGAAVLLFVAGTKIVVALMRGRTNILFLVIFAAIALVIAAGVVFRKRTAKGDALLSEMKNLFAALKLRAPDIQPGGATAELALLTAVFGLSALPAAKFEWKSKLFPKADSSSASSSCGSSSCGSSCSSSCGGGGCGGGCGGCGS